MINKNSPKENGKIINPITGKISLINKFEAYTNEGAELDGRFYALIEKFVSDACKKFDSTQVQYILSSSLSNVCCTDRICNANKLMLKLRKEKTNERPSWKASQD